LIQELPTGYRIVFNMYVVEGYSHQEIAEVLEISVNTSKSQLFKAKAMLRKQVKQIFATADTTYESRGLQR
jgi:RNA polymerase sigma-70 factor (ECF subfamily)